MAATSSGAGMFPAIGTYVALCIDADMTLEALGDPQVTEVTKNMKTKFYVGYISGVCRVACVIKIVTSHYCVVPLIRQIVLLITILLSSLFALNCFARVFPLGQKRMELNQICVHPCGLRPNILRHGFHFGLISRCPGRTAITPPSKALS